MTAAAGATKSASSTTVQEHIRDAIDAIRIRVDNMEQGKTVAENGAYRCRCGNGVKEYSSAPCSLGDECSEGQGTTEVQCRCGMGVKENKSAPCSRGDECSEGQGTTAALHPAAIAERREEEKKAHEESKYQVGWTAEEEEEARTQMNKILREKPRVLQKKQVLESVNGQRPKYSIQVKIQALNKWLGGASADEAHLKHMVAVLIYWLAQRKGGEGKA
jgi:hypothetical protein